MFEAEEIRPGNVLLLQGVSRAGRGVIRRRGFRWLVLDMQQHVEFDIEPGPWLAVTPLSSSQGLRWIHVLEDDDLIIAGRYRVLPVTG
jgi:hypothetical protein